MLDLRADMALQLATLRAGGVRAVADPRNVNPPCLLVLPPAISWRMSCAAAVYTAYALATDPGTEQALVQLSALLTGVQDALAGSVIGAEPADVTLPDGSGTVPGYAISWNARLPT